MAKKEETISLVDTFSEFKELKNIDRTTMVSVLEESFRSVIAKMFGTDENYDVIVNPDKGDFEIWRNREVVADDELTNPNMQISLTEARKIDASYEVGEDIGVKNSGAGKGQPVQQIHRQGGNHHQCRSIPDLEKGDSAA